MLPFVERGWSRRSQLIAIAIWFVVLASVGRCGLHHQARSQTPKTFPDSYVYFEIAEQPTRLAHLFYPKPFVVPFVYRALDRDGERIESFQQCFAIGAWCLLGLVGALCVRRTRSRLAMSIIALAFLFAPYRVGWTSVALSESINDSLMALVIAAAIGLATVAMQWPSGRMRSLACWSMTVVLGGISTAWMLARDTNAITALVAAVLAAAIWRLDRHVRGERWAVALIAWTIAIAGFTVWSAGVTPRAPLGIPWTDTWQPEILARGTPSAINYVSQRVLTTPGGREFFVERGLPQADELARAGARGAGASALMLDPELSPARVWIAEHKGVYAEWLVAHPLARANELALHLWDVLAPSDLSAYMPDGWRTAGVLGHGSTELTSGELILIGLLIAAPLLVRRAWRHPYALVACVLVASGVVGAAAAYYGDTIEMSRHCYGSGQQIVLGLFVAVVAWLERTSRRASPERVTMSRDTRRDRSADPT